MKRSLVTMLDVATLPVQHRLERIDLDLSPAEVAARCSHLPGLVFFDSAALPALSDGERAYSILGARPVVQVVGGDEAAWEGLCRLVGEMPRAEMPFPTMIVAGWVEYEGTLCFGVYDRLLIFEHPGEPGALGVWHSIGGLEQEMVSLPIAEKAPEPLGFTSSMVRESYMEKVQQAQEWIAKGDIYQVNLTHRFTAPWAGGVREGLALYQRLRQASPAPWAAYLHLQGRQVLSSSPELFLAMDGQRIATRPIKGTRPRRHLPEEDRQSADELVGSPKERAELVMITDLERNDLGRICRYGTVRVREMLHLETYPQVFHLISTVEGDLRPEVGVVEALRSCFPGGSITGAPKKRAMEIIRGLEGAPRGLYTGTIGYFGNNGRSRFNIAIRTLVLEGGEAYFQVGAGIVADSDPAAEWEETLHKASGILLATQNTSL